MYAYTSAACAMFRNNLVQAMIFSKAHERQPHLSASKPRAVVSTCMAFKASPLGFSAKSCTTASSFVGDNTADMKASCKL